MNFEVRLKMKTHQNLKPSRRFTQFVVHQPTSMWQFDIKPSTHWLHYIGTGIADMIRPLVINISTTAMLLLSFYSNDISQTFEP